MALQTARYLVASFEKLSAGKRLTGSVSYLESLPRINRAKRTWPVQSEKALRSGSLRSLLDAFRFLLAKKVERVSLRFREEKKRAERGVKGVKTHDRAKQKKGGKGGKIGVTARGAAGGAISSSTVDDLQAAEKQAWNGLTPELLDCSRGHCYYVMSENFVAAVEQAGLSTDPNERSLFPSLDMLCRLFVLKSLSEWLDWFLAMGYMDKRQMFLVKEGVDALCEEARGIAVPAVDAFGYSDLVLRSPLGRRDGNVYTAYFDRVCEKPGVDDRSPDYLTHMKPLLTAML